MLEYLINGANVVFLAGCVYAAYPTVRVRRGWWGLWQIPGHSDALVLQMHYANLHLIQSAFICVYRRLQPRLLRNRYGK